MKKSVLMIASASSVALLACGAALATDPHAHGKAAVSAGTAVAGSFALGANGSSTSYAHNSESARAGIHAATSHKPGYRSVDAAVQGTTRTESAGVAYNSSTGSGYGNALSAGHAHTATRGAIGIDGVTGGYNGGGSGTHAANLIKAGKNQGSYVDGQTVSGFEAEVHYARSGGSSHAPYGHAGGGRNAAVEVSGSSTGYASGASASGALEHMNAAGFSNIGSSGYFFGRTGVSGSTGYVTAP